MGRIVIERDNFQNEGKNESVIEIGDGFCCNSGEKYNLIGGDNRTALRTINNGQIFIGKNVSVSNVTVVSWSRVVIEDEVMLGGSVKIYDSDFHSLQHNIRFSTPYEDIKCRPVRICKGAFIGAGSYVLKGVTIGENSVIGAGSVVTKNIPNNEIWAGNPAKFIRKID